MTLPPQIELRARCAEADDLFGLIFRMLKTSRDSSLIIGKKR